MDDDGKAAVVALRNVPAADGEDEDDGDDDDWPPAIHPTDGEFRGSLGNCTPPLRSFSGSDGSARKQQNNTVLYYQ